MPANANRRDVAVVGAGTAGLAAAVALARDGAGVTLLERRPFVGGRAYSYSHPALGEIIDSQHVVVGCCTNFLDLIAQAGAADSIRWYDELCFLEPTAAGSPRQSWIGSGGLPAPAHNSLSFLRAPMLTLHDKARIAAGLAHFLRGCPATDEESFAAWLKHTRQTDRGIRHFWEPVVAGALNDGFERCSTKYAAKVFHESFLRSPEAGRLGIPAAPLSEFFQPVVDLAQSLGVDVRTNASVEAITRTVDGRWKLETREGEVESDAVILATGFRQTQDLIQSLTVPGASPAIPFDKFFAAPITTIHLWYDREVTDLDHAVLLDTRIQWVFAKSRIRRWEPARGSYLELVISASWPEIDMPREQILASALREVELFFPRVREATLLKSAVLKEARATFSVTPGLDRYRPPQTTAYPSLYVAGDWTATEWPSTMEGAVRSGRMAAGELLGKRTRFLAPETPATGLMRWLSRAP
ncbi:MAG: hydroxysqualene dehydroxylase HpnE [Acidobacteriaceae bacterium]|jgi:zeta-carotene desaturase